MKRNIPKTASKGLVLGDKTFAAITAVEGISLSAASSDRLATLAKSKLSAAEQRKRVIMAYSGRVPKG